MNGLTEIIALSNFTDTFFLICKGRPPSVIAAAGNCQWRERG